MKAIKLKVLMAGLLLSLGVMHSQNDSFQTYLVHEDEVIPSKVMAYEQAAKQLADKAKEHNIQSTQWLATSTSNFRYLYVTPIDKMADLDDNGLAELMDKMGVDSFSSMMSSFDECYDRHGSYVIVMDKELTYMPDGISQTQDGKDFRKFYNIYYTPKNAKDIREAMREVKNLFKAKGSKTHYRVYRTAFGTMDSYYMVAVSAKDAVELEQNAAENDKLIGEDGQKALNKVISLSSRFEEYTGLIRPDLAYSPKKEN